MSKYAPDTTVKIKKLKFKKGDCVLTTGQSMYDTAPSGQYGVVTKIDETDLEFPYQVNMENRKKYNRNYWYPESELELAFSEINSKSELKLGYSEINQDEDTINIKAPKVLEDDITAIISEHYNKEHRKEKNRKALEKLHQILVDNVDSNDFLLNDMRILVIRNAQKAMQEQGDI